MVTVCFHQLRSKSHQPIGLGVLLIYFVYFYCFLILFSYQNGRPVKYQIPYFNLFLIHLNLKEYYPMFLISKTLHLKLYYGIFYLNLIEFDMLLCAHLTGASYLIYQCLAIVELPGVFSQYFVTHCWEHHLLIIHEFAS